MRTLLALLVIIASALSASAARAFDHCDKLFATPDELGTFLREEGVQSAPVKYFAKAKSIRIETDGAGRLIPFATYDSQRNPIIVYPANFPPVLCRLVLTTYLGIETDSDLLTEPARDAGRCIAAKRPAEACIVDYANGLERRYRAAFAKQDEHSKNIAYGIVRDAIGQIAKHEFAHHLLNHLERVRSGGFPRIDAEFEADYYAVLYGTETGETTSAMYYFFHPLEAMEDSAPEIRSQDYESASCRATNISDVTGVFGVAPRVLLDTTAGMEVKNNNPPELMRTVAQQLAKEYAPAPRTAACGRLAPEVLRESHEELRRLTALVAEYADLLPATADNTDDQSGRALRNPANFKLVVRLQRASQELTHLKGLAARAMSYVIHRVELGGAQSSVSRELDSILQSSEDEYLSGDYGRILNVRAVSVLYDDPTAPVAARMNKAEPLFRKAVEFLPKAMEAWLNLGFIALARGDCNKAAEMADKSARTADPPWRTNAESFRDAMRELSRNPERCALEAERFTFGERR